MSEDYKALATKDEFDRLSQRVDDLIKLVSIQQDAVGHYHEAFKLLEKLYERQGQKSQAMLEGQIKRSELTTIVAGYLWGAMEEIRKSGQISPNMEARIDGHLSYVRPTMAKIMGLPEDSFNVLDFAAKESPDKPADAPPT